jgi:hypothetical protein
MYLYPQPRMNGMGSYLRGPRVARRRLRGLGMNPNQSGPPPQRAVTPTRFILPPLGPSVTGRGILPGPSPVICPAWGCGPAPITGPYVLPGPGSAPKILPPGSSGGSTSAQTAGTPVPPGFSQNEIFVNSDGSQWIFSASQSKWISMGTPYNTSGPGAGTPAATTPSNYPGSPVPSTWSTSQVYTDSSGNQWAYNPGYGTFQMMPSLASSVPATSASSGVPAGTSTNAPYTDASGNTWVYNASTGQWSIASSASSSPYTSILNFLSDTSLGAAVGFAIPNWIVLAGLGFVALKFSHPSGSRR